ncbi:hypothetical protein B0T17DRAFT_616039 [Bombardia bombarda]|uniref:Uncharacterized protein n=1 Tax=Bombardia bombarda TaxID=252184 RepID=A0AA39XAJ4_9PEZI|nr:hypothetical protein B0T17DRAFT_616039 [Bombardia bombarda]
MATQHQLANAEKLTQEKKVNLFLLRCKVLLETDEKGVLPAWIEDDIKPLNLTVDQAAMYYANSALEIANRIDKWRSIAKCHLYRGHVFRKMKWWSDARDSYIRAASDKRFAADKGDRGLEELISLCKRMKDNAREKRKEKK